MFDFGYALGAIIMGLLLWWQKRILAKATQAQEDHEVRMREVRNVIDYGRLMILEEPARAREFFGDYQTMERDAFLEKWKGFRP